jgi:hypothetical protein
MNVNVCLHSEKMGNRIEYNTILLPDSQTIYLRLLTWSPVRKGFRCFLICRDNNWSFSVTIVLVLKCDTYSVLSRLLSVCKANTVHSFKWIILSFKSLFAYFHKYFKYIFIEGVGRWPYKLPYLLLQVDPFW